MRPRIGASAVWAARRVALVIALLLTVAPAVAAAGVERFALVVGADRGDRDEVTLRYAVDDAEKVAAVLSEVGGVPGENLTLLKDQGADAVRRALIALNERVRVRRRGGAEIVLFVYYSGHADAEALHLGGSRLALDEIEGLVRGSPADLRVLLIDACRSGALTRVKGGRPAPPVTVSLDDRLRGEGLAILSSVSGSEDAQESDTLRGSFFTHYLVSALLGAGDDDGDGQVTLREAYRHAYGRTVSASSRTLAGTQHPSFHFDLRGRGDIVLTWVRGVGDRPTLNFPRGVAFVVVRRDDDGAVVAEVGEHDRARTLSLSPGRYRIVGRTDDALLEGDVELISGHRAVALDGFRRVEYARLVRKGGGASAAVHGPMVGVTARSGLVEGESACLGGMVGWPIERALFTLTPRLGFCRSELANDFLTGRTWAFDGELRLAHAWDLRRLTLDLGLVAGAGALHQSFESRGAAPSNLSAAGHLGVSASALIDLPEGAYLALEISTAGWVFRASDAGEAALAARVAARAGVVVGFRL